MIRYAQEERRRKENNINIKEKDNKKKKNHLEMSAAILKLIPRKYNNETFKDLERKDTTMTWVQSMIRTLDMSLRPIDRTDLAASDCFVLWDSMKSDPYAKPNVLTYVQLMKACVMSKHR